MVHTIGIRVIAVAAAGGMLLAGLLATSPANSVEPASVPAVDMTQYHATLDVTLPPNGTATATSPTIPSNAKSMAIDIETGLTKDERLAVDLHATLATLSNRDRLLTCAAIGSVGMGASEYAAEAGNTPAAMGLLKSSQNAMNVCFQVVQYLVAPRSAHGSKATAPVATCPQSAFSVPITKTGSGATASYTVAGAAKMVKKTPLRITCTETPTGMSITFKPRSKKATLRKVVGPNLALGFSSPAGSTTPIALQLKYANPR
ncbi:MAG: hypothetical protein Q7K25_07570 [Actinomycetota bacterium]|nr:hypothetical protein [Actinomycetota bacterium]